MIGQDVRIQRRRNRFHQLCEALPGWKWLSNGSEIVGAIECPCCRGLMTVDIGNLEAPECRCQRRGCRWMGLLPTMIRQLGLPYGRQQGAV